MSSGITKGYSEGPKPFKDTFYLSDYMDGLNI